MCEQTDVTRPSQVMECGTEQHCIAFLIRMCIQAVEHLFQALIQSVPNSSKPLIFQPWYHYIHCA
jgi:hypothetical protein